jgi:CRP-like cAMP-binding protein
LSPNDYALLQPHLTAVALERMRELEKPSRRINDVYFIDAGIASVVAIQNGNTQVEVGLVGCEGMTGTSIVLGTDSSPHSTYVQVAGAGQRIAAGDLRRAIEASTSLHRVLLRYVQAFLVQTAQSAIANARAKVSERLARWILMAHDRVAGDTVLLTHEFLALMLGVRRAGVTEALHDLAGLGLIASNRGEIAVRDRKGLERHAGHSYGVPEAEYKRLIR